MKQPWAVLNTNCWEDKESCRFTEFANVGETRLRISIACRIQKTRNFATVAVWGRGQWNTLYSIPYTQMNSICEPDSGDEITTLDFMEDADALRNFATEFFNIKNA